MYPTQAYFYIQTSALPSPKQQVSVAVDALRREGVPFVSVLADPTYGGVSASYAMQADVRVAVGSARIGFAGPAVILNTMFEMDQSKFDEACPENFQVSQAVRRGGGGF